MQNPPRPGPHHFVLVTSDFSWVCRPRSGQPAVSPSWLDAQPMPPTGLDSVGKGSLARPAPARLRTGAEHPAEGPLAWPSAREGAMGLGYGQSCSLSLGFLCP